MMIHSMHDCQGLSVVLLAAFLGLKLCRLLDDETLKMPLGRDQTVTKVLFSGFLGVIESLPLPIAVS